RSGHAAVNGRPVSSPRVSHPWTWTCGRGRPAGTDATRIAIGLRRELVARAVRLNASARPISVRRERLVLLLRCFHGGHVVLHRLLHLFKGAHLDLTHALARDAELVGKLLERNGVVGKPTRLEDAPLAVVEHGQRLAQRLAAVVGLLALDQPGLLARRVV